MSGFVITLALLLLAIVVKRDGLSLLLGVSWVISAWVAFLEAQSAITLGIVPGAAAIVDVLIATGAAYLWTSHGSQRARLVGLLSLAKLTAHFGISANFGAGDWHTYAVSVNALFCAQCLVAMGAAYGLVNFIDNISPWRGSGGALHNSAGN